MSKESDSLIKRGDNAVVSPFEATVRPMLAEFVGIALFVFVGCLSVQDPLGLAGKTPSAPAVALTHGFMIAVLVIAFGNISGAHLNPAVTLAILLCKAITPFLALVYFVTQCVGAIVGAAFARAVLPLEVYKDINGGAHILTAVGPGAGILCEMLLTTVLVLTALMTTVDDRNKSSLAGIAIGFSVVVCTLAGINTTGASMNPARSLGPAIALSIYDSDVWTYHYVYWVGPLLGAVVSAFLYRFVFASSEQRLFFKGYNRTSPLDNLPPLA